MPKARSPQAETTLIAAQAHHGNAMALVEAAQETADADADAASEAGRVADTARDAATAAAADGAATTLDGTTVTVRPLQLPPTPPGLLRLPTRSEIEAAAKADTADRSRKALESARADLEEKAAVLTEARDRRYGCPRRARRRNRRLQRGPRRRR